MLSRRTMLKMLGLGVVSPSMLWDQPARASGNGFCPYDQPGLLTASVYAPNSEPPRLLFKFRRTVSCSDSFTSVLREYTYPDGKLAARERVLYEGPALRSYELDELQTGSVGSVRVENDAHNAGRVTLSFEYFKDPARRSHGRNSSHETPQGALVDDMIGGFLSANYDRLETGAKVNCRYIVVSRRETVGLTFTKQSESTHQGRQVIILRLQPTSPLISVLVDPLFFTLEKAPPHRVIKYVGRTTPKIFESGHWKDLDAVTVFDW